MKPEQHDEYECSHCGKMFTRVLWSLDKSFQRTHFGTGLNEVETIDSQSIAGYCSKECLGVHAPKVMSEEGVPIPAMRPGIGPVEACAICRGPVDMTKFHQAFGYSQVEQMSSFEYQPRWTDDLAVTCNGCRPQFRAATYEEPKVSLTSDTGVAVSR